MFFENNSDHIDKLDEGENYHMEENSDDERRHAEEDLYCQLHFESITDEQNEYSITDFGSNDNSKNISLNFTSTYNLSDIEINKKYKICSTNKLNEIQFSNLIKPQSSKIDLVNLGQKSITSKEVTIMTCDKNSQVLNSISLPPCIDIEDIKDYSKIDKDISEKYVNKEKCLKEILENFNLSSDINEFTDILKSSDESVDKLSANKDTSDEDYNSHESEENRIKIKNENLVTNIDLNSSNSNQVKKMLDEILSSIPKESNWSICEADKQGLYNSPNRYFENKNKLSCKNCDEKGHNTARCPNPKRLEPCIFCTKNEHRHSKCPFKLCLKCNESGHIARVCNIGWPNIKCPRCNQKGHHEKLCPDKWRQYHLTTSEENMKRHASQSNKNKSCYNCSSIEHFGHRCTEKPSDPFLHSISPFIFKYDYYDKTKNTRTVKLNLQKPSYLSKNSSSTVKENFVLKNKENYSIKLNSEFSNSNISQDNYIRKDLENDNEAKPKNIFKLNVQKKYTKNIPEETRNLKDKMSKQNKKDDTKSKRGRRRKRKKEFYEDFVHQLKDSQQNDQTFKKSGSIIRSLNNSKSYNNISKRDLFKFDKRSGYKDTPSLTSFQESNILSNEPKNCIKTNKSTFSGKFNRPNVIRNLSNKNMPIHNDTKNDKKHTINKNKDNFFSKNRHSVKQGKS